MFGRIYKIINLINDKSYVGQTVKPVNDRISQHLNCVKNGQNHPLYDSIRKYGWKNFKVETIDVADTVEELNIKEKYWITYFNAIHPNGFNMTDGGFGYKRLPFTKKHRKNLSLALTGRIIPEETRKKMGWHRRGIKVSDETRLKMRLAHKGKPNGRKGTHHTEETKRKISLTEKITKRKLMSSSEEDCVRV